MRENRRKLGLFANSNLYGQSVTVKTTSGFQIANKINDFAHDAYGTALF
jgi:hypothetical protein